MFKLAVEKYPPYELHIKSVKNLFIVLREEVSEVFVTDGRGVLRGVSEPLEGIDLMFLADGEERVYHCRSLGVFVASCE